MSIDVSTKQKDGIATNGSYDHYPVGFFEISPCFFYGPGVSSEYDNNGRIIKQTFKQAGSNSPTRNYSFEYDSDNKVITSLFGMKNRKNLQKLITNTLMMED